MNIPLICPNPLCQKQLLTRDGLAGKYARCAACRTVLIIPGHASVAEASAELPHPEEIPPDEDDLPLLNCVDPVLVWTPVGDPDKTPTAQSIRGQRGVVSEQFRASARTFGIYSIVIGLIYTIEGCYRLVWEEAGVIDLVKLLLGTLWIGSGYRAWKRSLKSIRLALSMSYLYLIGAGWLVLSGNDIHRRDFIGWLVLVISLVMIYTAHDALGNAKR